MTAKEVSQKLVEYIQTGDVEGAYTNLYHPDIVSIEAAGENPVSNGIDACRHKGAWFDETFEVHGSEVKGPYPNGEKFALFLSYDVTHKQSGQRFPLEEAAIYEVADGKIVWEKFYNDMPNS
jgi:ketosteroid isomerase-like protein